MPNLSITLQPEQEIALRRDYDRFCELLTNTITAAPVPTFEQYVVAKLTGNTAEIADEMVRSIVTSGACLYLDQWLNGRFSSFVMTFLRMLRSAGYGFVRARETSDETLAKGTAWLLDSLESEFGLPIPAEAREEILRDMPRSAYLVEALFPSESIGRLFDVAEQYLRKCYTQYSQTLDERCLDKAELLIEFLSEIPEWQGVWVENWQRNFHDAREALRRRRESRMSVVDRVLKRLVEHREAVLSQ